MFIFCLGINDDSDYTGYLEDRIEMVSTDIQKILDYLSLDKMSYTTITRYSIIIKIDGEADFYDEFTVKKDMHEHLLLYPPKELQEQEVEFADIKCKVTQWCRDISIRLEKERISREEARRVAEELEERALYEKLKEKYEGQ